MTHDRIGDRNRFLEGQGFNSADLEHKGVTEWDSAEAALGKLLGGNSTSSGGGGGYDAGFGSASGGEPVTDSGTDGVILVFKIFGAGFALYLLCCIVWAAFSAKDELLAHWRSVRSAEIAEQRIKDYSDFSKLSDWPQEVQAVYRKQEGKPLGKLLDEIPTKLSPEKRHVAGAQIWFKISREGTGARDLLMAVQEAPHRVDNPILRAGGMSLDFLKTECKKGVELACLDAAKSFAGLVWHGKGSAEQRWVIKAALDQLPSSGPLAHSNGVESLRVKLLATQKSLQH